MESDAPDQEAAPHIVIIGGGITGLSAAYALQQRNGIRTTLIESAAQLGGKIRTDIVEHDGQFVIEAGPDSILAQKPAGIALARALGLGDKMIGNNRERKTVYVLSHGKPVAMPEGLALIVPTDLGAFWRSPLLSLFGRLRVLAEMFIPTRRDPQDEALGDFITRRFGREAVEYMGEPLMAGIHNAEIDRQSILATFPRFHTTERSRGSLIRAMRADRRKASATPGQAATSPFISFKGGLQTLVDQLAATLTCRIQTNTSARAITRSASGYHVALSNGEILDADAVILTTPAYIAADLLDDLAPEVAAGIRDIRYVSTATISLAYRADDVGDLLGGTGMLVPRVEKRQINAVTVSSIKYAHRAPDGAVLLRAFTGGSHNPAVLKLDDAEMLAVVRRELRELLGINAEPLFSRIYRWERSNPQYDVGHLDRISALEAHCPERLFLAGCAYRGVGIPDCIQQGQAVAERALAMVGTAPPAVA